MKEENAAALRAGTGAMHYYRVRDEVPPRTENNAVPSTTPTMQDREAGTLRGRSIMFMGLEPAVVSERPSGPPG
jgi:hypothetical protein